jgi:hypothetical protein
MWAEATSAEGEAETTSAEMVMKPARTFTAIIVTGCRQNASTPANFKILSMWFRA